MKKYLTMMILAAFVFVGCTQQRKALVYDENAPCTVTDSSAVSTNFNKVQTWGTEKAEEGKTVTIWKDKQSGEFKACIKK